MRTDCCPIWATQAEMQVSGGYNGWAGDSPRAGGLYRISDQAQVNLRSFSDQQKALLTTWLVDERRAGVAWPTITTDILDAVERRRPQLFAQRMDRLLMHLADKVPLIGVQLMLGSRDLALTRAACECSYDDELKNMMLMLIELGMIKGGGSTYSLSAKGYERRDQLAHQRGSSRKAFVAMWFNPATVSAYEEAIGPAIREAGYEPTRIDQKEHSNKIDDEIIAEIRLSRFVVADFTCGFASLEGKPVGIARGGVYYEAGFAQGLGIQVIWTCHADCVNDLHFDTRQFAHIVWKDPPELRKALRNRILAVIGEGPIVDVG